MKIASSRSLCEIDAATHGTLAPILPDDAFNPFISHAFLSALEKSGFGDAQDRLARPASRPGGRQRASSVPSRPAISSRTAMGEYVFDHGWADAFERAGGRLLSEAAGVGSLHAGDRPPAAGADAGIESAARSRPAPALLPRPAPARSTSPSCRKKIGTRFGGTAPWLQAHRHQFHWLNQGYADLRRFPCQTSPRASARTSARSATRCMQPGISFDWVTGNDHHRRALGRILSLSTWTPARANGARPISTRQVLQPDRREHGRPHPARPVQARRAGSLPGLSISSARMRSTGATGAPSSIIPSCISRPATIRPSNSPSRTSSRASRRAPRVRTSWRAAICRKPPTACTILPIPGLPRAVARLSRTGARARCAEDQALLPTRAVPPCCDRRLLTARRSR